MQFVGCSTHGVPKGGMEIMQHGASLTARDKLQVAAFKSIFRSNPDLRPEMRLARAVVATCDEALKTYGKESLIQEWIQNYACEASCTYEM